MVWWRPREMQSYTRTCPGKEPRVDHRDGTRVRRPLPINIGSRLCLLPVLFKSAAKFQRYRMRIRLRAALHRCVGGYNFREFDSAT
jgi:hypothetical protein